LTTKTKISTFFVARPLKPKNPSKNMGVSFQC
jgi:hypothetical protein